MFTLEWLVETRKWIFWKERQEGILVGFQYAINQNTRMIEMPQYAKPTKKDMEDAIESNKQSQEQIESAIEDIDMKSAEYKEAADMMEETKRRAEVVELAEKLWLRNLKDLAEYSYYDAFKDAETFIKLKSKYLKEGKLC